MTKIVVLSAGRRVSLVRCFQQAAKSHGFDIVAADLNPSMSAACHIADSNFTLPHVNSPEYAEKLLAYCMNNNVRLVVPTIDTELLRLSELQAQLNDIGCTAVVSNPDIISICRDKRRTSSYFEAKGIRSPALFQADNLPFPVFIKPYDGSLSSGAAVVRTADDLTQEMLRNPKNMFCQFLDPRDYSEFTCDAYFNRDGHLKCVVPRLRVEVRGGEVSKGRTSKNEIVPFLFEKLGRMEGARGCLTIQIMRHNSNGELFLLEINPRFGGGYPLTARSNALYHTWLIDEYILGKPVDRFDDWQDGLTMLRYDGEVFVER